MSQPLRIGIIGDWNPSYPSHIATNQALGHAAGALGVPVECSWLPTEWLDGPAWEKRLEGFDALWCASGSPYRSMAGALRAIQFARERGRPFVAT